MPTHLIFDCMGYSICHPYTPVEDLPYAFPQRECDFQIDWQMPTNLIFDYAVPFEIHTPPVEDLP